MAGYKLIEKAKLNQGLSSDNGLAKLLGKSRQNISTWRNTESKPDADTVLLLVELAGVDAKEGRKLLNGGFIDLSLLIMTGLGAIALLASNFMRQVCILCKMNGQLFMVMRARLNTTS